MGSLPVSSYAVKGNQEIDIDLALTYVSVGFYTYNGVLSDIITNSFE